MTTPLSNERLRQCRADRKALCARVAELVAVLREVEWEQPLSPLPEEADDES